MSFERRYVSIGRIDEQDQGQGKIRNYLQITVAYIKFEYAQSHLPHDQAECDEHHGTGNYGLLYAAGNGAVNECKNSNNG